LELKEKLDSFIYTFIIWFHMGIIWDRDRQLWKCSIFSTFI